MSNDEPCTAGREWMGGWVGGWFFFFIMIFYDCCGYSLVVSMFFSLVGRSDGGK